MYRHVDEKPEEEEGRGGEGGGGGGEGGGGAGGGELIVPLREGMRASQALFLLRDPPETFWKRAMAPTGSTATRNLTVSKEGGKMNQPCASGSNTTINAIRRSETWGAISDGETEECSRCLHNFSHDVKRIHT